MVEISESRMARLSDIQLASHIGILDIAERLPFPDSSFDIIGRKSSDDQ